MPPVWAWQAQAVLRQTPAKFETADMGDMAGGYFVPDGRQSTPSVLTDCPLFLTVRPSKTGHRRLCGFVFPARASRAIRRSRAVGSNACVLAKTTFADQVSDRFGNPLRRSVPVRRAGLATRRVRLVRPLQDGFGP